MKVLIPIEVKPGESLSVKAAAERPWPPGTAFWLLHVIAQVFPPMPAPRLLESARATIFHQLDRAAEPLRKAGWNVRTEAIEGSPRRVINLLAKEWSADLIMIGAHERSYLARLCLGGTAQAVMRHAPCSVEIVRPRKDGREQRRGMKILAATDGSAFSEAAMRSVGSRPWPEGSELKVISVPEFVPSAGDSDIETHPSGVGEDPGVRAVEEAKRYMTAAREILAGCPLRVTAELPKYEDRPYQAILRQAEDWQADLIVVGSHGRSGFDRVVMGSVSEAVALHAKCSVEIVRDAQLELEESRRAA